MADPYWQAVINWNNPLYPPVLFLPWTVTKLTKYGAWGHPYTLRPNVRKPVRVVRGARVTKAYPTKGAAVYGLRCRLKELLKSADAMDRMRRANAIPVHRARQSLAIVNKFLVDWEAP